MPGKKIIKIPKTLTGKEQSPGDSAAMDVCCLLCHVYVSTSEVRIARVDVDDSFTKHEFERKQEIAVEVAPARSRQSGGMADGLLPFWCRGGHADGVADDPLLSRRVAFSM